MAHPQPIALPAKPRRGAASLIVVMVLFFIMALAGAYSSRNLIFEQRTSANQYRSTQAIEAAEAGVEWALAMLNGGRIGTDCREAGAAAAATSFRQRHLNVLADGSFLPAPDPDPPLPVPALPVPPPHLMAGCVFDGTDWVCNCPTEGLPVLAVPVGAGPFPAFRVRLNVYDPYSPNINDRIINKPGLVMIEVNGCTRTEAACLDFPGSPSDQEGRATLRVIASLKSALPTPPAAALVVRDSVLRNPVGGPLMELVNVDPESGGVTIQAGGGINPGLLLRSIPGSAGESFLANDELLNDVSPKSLKVPVLPLNPNRVFASVFGTLPETYRLQPAAIPFTCPPTNCRQVLANLVTFNPGRVVWVDGNLNLDSAGDIGTLPDAADPAVTGPVVIVVTGNVIADFNARVFGFIYSQRGNWTGAPEIQGAAFVEDGLAATAGGRIVYDRAVIDHLRYRSGSFVRVPGGWRDFR